MKRIGRLGPWLLAALAAALPSFAASAPAPSARTAAPPAAPARTEKATFAAGCFWCAEAAFEGKPGVISVVSGYSGGEERDPTYEQVSAGRTGHYESVQVTFDPAKIGYERILDIFWRNVDPTQGDGQFCDRGGQYRSAIFVMSATQRRIAEESRRRLVAKKRWKAPVVTPVLEFRSFWPAEAYHQDYHRKNPVEYRTYRLGCGRDRRLRELWGEGAPPH